jgi:hypothetical protein
MVCDLWLMVYGLWFMVYGLWFVVFGLWFDFVSSADPEPKTPIRFWPSNFTPKQNQKGWGSTGSLIDVRSADRPDAEP